MEFLTQEEKDTEIEDAKVAITELETALQEAKDNLVEVEAGVILEA